MQAFALHHPGGGAPRLATSVPRLQITSFRLRLHPFASTLVCTLPSPLPPACPRAARHQRRTFVSPTRLLGGAFLRLPEQIIVQHDGRPHRCDRVYACGDSKRGVGSPSLGAPTDRDPARRCSPRAGLPAVQIEPNPDPRTARVLLGAFSPGRYTEQQQALTTGDSAGEEANARDQPVLRDHHSDVLR
jgi:hypothetical protein